jgi:hypothetical protein
MPLRRKSGTACRAATHEKELDDEEEAVEVFGAALVALPDNELALVGFLKVITLFNFNDGTTLRNIKSSIHVRSISLLPDGLRFVCIVGGGGPNKISVLEHGLALK